MRHKLRFRLIQFCLWCLFVVLFVGWIMLLGRLEQVRKSNSTLLSVLVLFIFTIWGVFLTAFLRLLFYLDLGEGSYELSVVIRAPRDQVFDLLADPVMACKAAGRETEVRELSRVPAIEGATWKARGSPLSWGENKYLVLAYERPRRLVRRITGGVVATVEEIFESLHSETKVTKKIEIERLPFPLMSAKAYREALQKALEETKGYIERQTSVGFSPDVESKKSEQPMNGLGGKVKCSYTVSPSTLIKGRWQLTIKSELLIAAPKERVFDIVIARPERFWEWHTDRSDPNIFLEVSPNWPERKSFYALR